MQKTETMARTLRSLFGAFATDATDDMVRGYVLGVGDIAPEKLQIAVARAIRECERLPRPVELRRLSGERTGDDRAIAAWADLQGAVPLGPYRHVDFADEIINGTVRTLGGWPSVIERFGSSEDEKWLRLEFVKIYASLDRSQCDGELLRPLAGLSEAQAVGGRVVAPVAIRIECQGKPKTPNKTIESSFAKKLMGSV